MIKYKKVSERDWNEYMLGRFYCEYMPYYRCPKTFNEQKQVSHLIEEGFPIRGRRKHLVDAWDDIRYSRMYRRSWKDCTKKKRQWE